MPNVRHIGVSKRIGSEEERSRLRQALESALGEQAQVADGYILRTAAEGVGDEELKGDLHFLHRMWSLIQDKRQKVVEVGCIYEDLPLSLRTLRDMVRPGMEKIRVDSREVYGQMVEFATAVNPDMLDLLEHYPGERPLFYLYNVEDEINRALERSVPLKSGGYLVIDQTEAMTTVDVNTGGFVGHINLEETIFKTNLEAATAIARQLRLRSLGGIIIIEFIDMGEAEHRRQILRTLQKALERDRATTRITSVSE